jgi:hypothetical protein
MASLMLTMLLCFNNHNIQAHDWWEWGLEQAGGQATTKLTVLQAATDFCVLSTRHTTLQLTQSCAIQVTGTKAMLMMVQLLVHFGNSLLQQPCPVSTLLTLNTASLPSATLGANRGRCTIEVRDQPQVLPLPDGTMSLLRTTK